MDPEYIIEHDSTGTHTGLVYGPVWVVLVCTKDSKNVNSLMDSLLGSSYYGTPEEAHNSIINMLNIPNLEIRRVIENRIYVASHPDHDSEYTIIRLERHDAR